MLKDGLDAEQAFIGNQSGDVKAALAGAAKTVEAVYAYPYQNHATMEPMNATALYTPDKCEVWCGDAERRGGSRGGRRSVGPAGQQSARSTRSCSAAASAGAGARDYVTQAVLIAKQMPGTPVKLFWSREEDMTARLLSPDHAMQS